MSSWPIRAIADVCDVVNGGTPGTGVAHYWNGPHRWVTPAEMGNRESPFISETERTITDAGIADSTARLIPPLSVILSSRAPIGHLVINEVAMAFNQGCKGVVPGSAMDFKFLYYWLLGHRESLEALGTGATFKELSLGKLKTVPIPVPSRVEQRRVVELLDGSLAGIAKLSANTNRNLSGTDTLTERSIVSKLASFSILSELPVSALAQAGRNSIRTGPFGSQLLHGEFVDDGIAVLGIDNAVRNEFAWGKRRYITEAKYQQLKRYTVRPGDVLITIMGTCGRCAVVPDGIPTAINTKHLCCITLDQTKCLPGFLHAYFLFHPKARAYLAAQAKGSIMDGLNMTIIQNLPVELPSIADQREIVQFVAELRAATRSLAAVQARKRDALAELRQAVLRHAFSGQLTRAPAIAA